MPDDDKPCPCSWLDKAKAVALVIAAVGTGIITPVLAALNLNRTEHVVDGQVVTHQKQDENAVKIDAAATTAAEVKNTLNAKESKTDAKLEDIKKQVSALPPAVANEVRKDKK